MPAKKNPKIPRGVIEHPPGTGIYTAQFRDQHGKRHREQAGSVQDAADLYALRKAQVRQGTFDPAMLKRRPYVPAGGTLLAAAIDNFLAESKATKITYRDDERFGAFWKGELGHVRLADVTRDDVRTGRRRLLKSKTRRGQPTRPATVNRYIAFLKRVFNVAIEAELCERNPVARLKMLPEENQQVGYLDDAQEAVLRDHFPEKHWHIPELAMHTGLREGEQFRIQRDHVDWVHAVLHVPRNKKRKARMIHLNSRAVELLRAQFDSHESVWLYPSPRDPRKHRDASSFYHRVWEASLERAGLPHLRWHDLRATFATRALEEGATMEEVRDQLGHTTLAMVQRYARLVESHKRVALERLVGRAGKALARGSDATRDATTENVIPLERRNGAAS